MKPRRLTQCSADCLEGDEGVMAPLASLHRRILQPQIAVLFACVGLASCDPLCLAKGRIAGADAAVGAQCSVRLHHTVGESPDRGVPCRRPDAPDGAPDRWVVNVGEEFACGTIPGLKGSRLDVSVSCDGYEPYRSQPFEWQVHGFTCASLELGVVQLRRAAEGTAHEPE
jgi:hypothetical protein